MMNKKLLSGLLIATVLSAPMPAAAQFGGLMKKAGNLVGGGSASDTGSVTNPDQFLSVAMLSTKNVMMSAALLSQALSNRDELASQKINIDAVQNAATFGELNAQKVQLEQNLNVIADRQDIAGDLTEAYKAGDAKQKTLIALAISNLALGAYRNINLASDAPKVVRSVGRDPNLMSRVGEFRAASSLVSLQASGFGKIGSALPKVMSALKIKELDKAGTDRPMPVNFD